MQRTGIAGLAMLAVLISGACDDNTSPTDSAVGDGQVDGKTGDGKTGDGKTGDGKTGDGKTGDGKTGDGTPSDGSGWDFFLPDAMNPGNLVPCGPSQTVYQCSNGNDDDGDKLIDALDPECTGPCDNSEGSFELNIPGVNKDCKQDCYWDYDSGAGNDDCDWNHKCDPLSPGTSYKPSCAYDAAFTQCTTTQSKACLDLCVPLTPNGCDCFGCCEVYVGGKKYKDTVYLGSGITCTAKTPQNCAPCTQQTSCANGCGVCELCLGKTIKDLPPSCFKPPTPDGGPTDAKPADIKPPWDGWLPPDQGLIIPWICPPGVKTCLTNNDCPASYYCITGCCQLSIS